MTERIPVKRFSRLADFDGFKDKLSDNLNKEVIENTIAYLFESI